MRMIGFELRVLCLGRILTSKSLTQKRGRAATVVALDLRACSVAEGGQHRGCVCSSRPAACLQQACCRPAAAGTALAHAPALCCLAAAGCRHADRGQQLLLPFLAFASTILTSIFFLNTTHAVQKPIIRTNNLALIPLLGNLGGDITCAAEEQENKILDSLRDVRRRTKIGAQNPRNLKLRIE